MGSPQQPKQREDSEFPDPALTIYFKYTSFDCFESEDPELTCLFLCVYMCESPGLLTMCGASLYIIYSNQALAETERLVGQEGLAYIHTSFGWSFGLAWLSYGLELLTGVLLLTAAQMAKLQHTSPIMA